LLLLPEYAWNIRLFSGKFKLILSNAVYLPYKCRKNAAGFFADFTLFLAQNGFLCDFKRLYASSPFIVCYTMIGKRIHQIRREKGMTQEQLSARAGINLRTLQRIEKGDTEPRGNTLRLLSNALGERLEASAEYGRMEYTLADSVRAEYGRAADHLYLAFLHLSALSFLFIPLGNILLPFILWMVRRDRVVGLHEQATGLLSFQIIWTLFAGACFFIFALGKLAAWPVGRAPLAGLVALCVMNCAYTLWVASRLYQGAVKNYYPEIVRFIR
jgi:transcriptional regulator with XRE-family HTH domain